MSIAAPRGSLLQPATPVGLRILRLLGLKAPKPHIHLLVSVPGYPRIWECRLRSGKGLSAQGYTAREAFLNWCQYNR